MHHASNELLYLPRRVSWETVVGRMSPFVLAVDKILQEFGSSSGIPHVMSDVFLLGILHLTILQLIPSLVSLPKH
jgi:hypothetical protein